MQKLARFTAVKPEEQVLSTTFSVTDGDGTVDYSIDPSLTEFRFEVTASPDNFGTCYLQDTNAAGKSDKSNEVKFSLTPVVPPPASPPTARTIIEVVDAPNSPSVGKAVGTPRAAGSEVPARGGRTFSC